MLESSFGESYGEIDVNIPETSSQYANVHLIKPCTRVLTEDEVGDTNNDGPCKDLCASICEDSILVASELAAVVALIGGFCGDSQSLRAFAIRVYQIDVVHLDCINCRQLATTSGCEGLQFSLHALTVAVISLPPLTVA